MREKTNCAKEPKPRKIMPERGQKGGRGSRLEKKWGEGASDLHYRSKHLVSAVEWREVEREGNWGAQSERGTRKPKKLMLISLVSFPLFSDNPRYQKSDREALGSFANYILTACEASLV